MPPTQISRRQFLQLLAASGAASALRPVAEPAAAQAGTSWDQPTAEGITGRPPPLRPYSVQLHCHANSNHQQGGHTGATQPGSVQWHTDWAASRGLETLWMSEHYQIYYPETDFVLPLETGILDPATWNVTGLISPYPQHPEHESGLDHSSQGHRHAHDLHCCSHTGPDGRTTVSYAQQMKASITGSGQTKAELIGPELHWRVRAGTGTTTFQYAPRTNSGALVWGYVMVKALLANVLVSVDVWRGDISANQKCQITLTLSYHRVGSSKTPVAHTIVYDLVDQAAPPVVIPDQQVTIPTVVPARTWTALTLNPTQDAQLIADGLDNSIQDIRFQVTASSGQIAEMWIRKVSIHSTQQDGPTNWQTGKNIFDGYRPRYPGLTGIYGIEMSLDDQHHLNVFLPADQNQLPDPNMTSEQLTAWAHSVGGVVSFNHPFGANVSLDTDLAHQDELVVDTANDLMEVNTYGADMMEIYDYRTCDLEHHLRLWDIMSANGYNILGIGSSDTHGGPWIEDVNYFVTWVWSFGPDADNLVLGMQSRALYFGSPFRFRNATFNYSAAGVSMGQTATVSTDQTTVTLQITGGRPNWEYRLRQYLLQPGTTLATVVGTPDQPWAVISGNSITVDTTRSSFVRVEIWDTVDGRSVAFGQTIVLNRV